MPPLEWYPAICSSMLGVLSNWVKVRWTWAFVILVGVLIYVALVLPYVAKDLSGVERTLYSGLFYWPWWFLTIFAVPFALGRYLYQLGRNVFLRLAERRDKEGT